MPWFSDLPSSYVERTRGPTRPSTAISSSAHTTTERRGASGCCPRRSRSHSLRVTFERLDDGGDGGDGDGERTLTCSKHYDRMPARNGAGCA